MTINCNGKLLDLSTPKVMGILNLTPDSFYDGGKYSSQTAIETQIEKLISEGADIIDLGAYSSRPGAKHIPEKEELERLIPVIQKVVKQYPKTILSIDTFRSNVAHICLSEGAALINDISAGELDSNMFATIAKHQVPYCMMHMKGTPKNMQDQPSYNNVTQDILLYFSEKIASARNLGINDIIVDPGFGFGKTTEHNFELLQHLELFTSLAAPILIGVSRKSMIYKTLDISPEGALNGTTALHAIALGKGAHILRVHDVKEARETIQLLEKLKS